MPLKLKFNVRNGAVSSGDSSPERPAATVLDPVALSQIPPLSPTSIDPYNTSHVYDFNNSHTDLSLEDSTPYTQVLSPEPAALVARSSRNSRDFVSTSPNFFGLDQPSDDELITSRPFHRRGSSASYFGSSLPDAAAGESPYLQPPGLTQPDSTLRRNMSALQLSDPYNPDDDDDTRSVRSDNSFDASDRRSEEALMQKGNQVLRSGQLSNSLARQNSSRSAKLQFSSTVRSGRDGTDIPLEAATFIRDNSRPSARRNLLEQNRMMTLSQFQRFRKDANVQDDNFLQAESESDSDERNDFESDSEDEHKQNENRMRQLNEEKLALYRQNMRRAMGSDSTGPDRGRTASAGSASQQLPTFAVESFGDADNEDVPLGQLRPFPAATRRSMVVVLEEGFEGSSRGSKSGPHAVQPIFGQQLESRSTSPSRGLIHEMEREQEIKSQRRSMLNMHMQLPVGHNMGNLVDAAGSHSHNPFIHQSYHTSASAQGYFQDPYPPLHHQSLNGDPPPPSWVPQQHMSVPPNVPLAAVAPDPTPAFGPELQSQMQQLMTMQLQMQMKIMQQMLQSATADPNSISSLMTPALATASVPATPPAVLNPIQTKDLAMPASPIHSELNKPISRPVSEISSRPYSLYADSVNQRGASPSSFRESMYGTNTNPSRYRTLSSQASIHSTHSSDRPASAFNVPVLASPQLASPMSAVFDPLKFNPKPEQPEDVPRSSPLPQATQNSLVGMPNLLNADEPSNRQNEPVISNETFGFPSRSVSKFLPSSFAMGSELDELERLKKRKSELRKQWQQKRASMNTMKQPTVMQPLPLQPQPSQESMPSLMETTIENKQPSLEDSFSSPLTPIKVGLDLEPIQIPDAVSVGAD
ncbi:uncharacterized protein V1516DRAFT_662082 [Lipomyces oligophaga]|uniref:uncharacterized protein n=1 Tax=Lipomyces oligophaga TaxID=45792 RepID=UPI0034CDFEA8